MNAIVVAAPFDSTDGPRNEWTTNRSDSAERMTKEGIEPMYTFTIDAENRVTGKTPRLSGYELT
jgi:hypothetical protein